jgi:hypothetical protein
MFDDCIQHWEDFVSRTMCFEQFIILCHGLVYGSSKMACFWPSNLNTASVTQWWKILGKLKNYKIGNPYVGLEPDFSLQCMKKNGQ